MPQTIHYTPSTPLPCIPDIDTRGLVLSWIVVVYWGYMGYSVIFLAAIISVRVGNEIWIHKIKGGKGKIGI